MGETDDWIERDDRDDERWDEDEDKWGCEFGVHCLMPSYEHLKSECFTVEMAEAWQEEYKSV